MSSLVLVSRIEDLGDDVRAVLERASHRSTSAARSSTRTSANRSRGRASSELPFYFTLYGTLDGVKANAQLLRNGQSLAEAPIELPPPTRSRVQHVGRFPIGALPGGTYQLRIRVSNDRQEISRTAFFTIRD